MLKTNSKQAIENIKKYIVENFNADYFDDEESAGIVATVDNFKQIATLIYNDFKQAKGWEVDRFRCSYQTAFIDWCQGLPSVLDTCYYYNRSAVEDVKNILQETDAEASKYSEEEAEKLLTCLIFREISKAINYNY